MPTNSVDLAYAIGLKPEEAIRYFESKGYAIGFNWHDVEARTHATAFTVAGILKQDILEDIRGGLNQALTNGETLEQFRRRLTPILEQKRLAGTWTQSGRRWSAGGQEADAATPQDHF
ncbi:phage head morphogenesis protein [Dickeya oryzae]